MQIQTYSDNTWRITDDVGSDILGWVENRNGSFVALVKAHRGKGGMQTETAGLIL